MCQVLNMAEFWILQNFRKYGRILNKSRDAIMEDYWKFQDSECARFLRMQAFVFFYSLFYVDIKCSSEILQ